VQISDPVVVAGEDDDATASFDVEYSDLFITRAGGNEVASGLLRLLLLLLFLLFRRVDLNRSVHCLCTLLFSLLLLLLLIFYNLTTQHLLLQF